MSRLDGDLRHKPHLLFTWLADLVRHPAILDAVEDVLGPNLLVWSTSFFIKAAGDPAYVSWHQDATYWGPSEPDVVTAWLAVTDATVDNGAMRMRAGEMSLHHVRMVHGSPPNRSDGRRIGFAIRYVPTRVKQLAGKDDSAMLVDGVDDYHHFAPERPPAFDLAPEARAHHAEAVARAARILYR